MLLSRVVAENHQRVRGAQASRQDPSGDRAHLPQRVLVSDGRPRRIHTRTLTKENRVGRLPRPVLQPVADTARAGLQRRGRFQPDAAVGAALGHDLGHSEQRPGILAAGGGG